MGTRLTPTNELRWVRYKANKWWDKERYIKLQQKFITEDGKEAWRLIPILKVDTEKEFWET